MLFEMRIWDGITNDYWDIPMSDECGLSLLTSKR